MAADDTTHVGVSEGFLNGEIMLRTPASQMRRAWIVLGAASLATLLLLVALITASIWVSRHATEPRNAHITFVSGTGALVRSPGDSGWRLIGSDERVEEGDSISTTLGTVVTLEAFDGTTFEISEDSVVTIRRMRSSRFIQRTKLIELEPERGAIYVNMQPAAEYGYSEVVVEAAGARVVMASERARQQAGSFLFEVISQLTRLAGDHQRSHGGSARTATVTHSGNELVLTDDQQTVISPTGEFGDITRPVRELIVNGAFQSGMDGWIDFRQQNPEHAGVVPLNASVELVPDKTPNGDVIALEISRPSSAGGGVVQAGVRQHIGKTLRVVTSLRLQLDVQITDQVPAGGGNDLNQFPLIVTMNYIDLEGKERIWSHGYYAIDDPAHPVDEFRASRIERDEWRRVSFDLSNLSPLPSQITSIVVYASGESFQTRIANVSLTTGELLRNSGAAAAVDAP
ncbi:MAG: hypothetical protein M9890_05085 [Thermomicrobiales bacterium]|nr:hypothetical protein [Thermomicrobiales bacterium]